jgi:uncharacterized protein YjbI with pentapeptide repeats
VEARDDDMVRLRNFWRRLTGWLTGRWAKNKKPLLVVLLIVVPVAVVLYLLVEAGYAFSWTGFGPYTPPQPPIEGYQREKTTWDWLQLLIIPVVLAVGGFLLNRTERMNTEKAAEQRAQDTALQAFLEAMTKLLLENHLRTSKPDDEVRSVARARTLTVLRALDGTRKARVLQFLYEARLIGGIKQEAGGVARTIDAVVSLQGARLEETFLTGADLGGADLEGAILNRALLPGADLGGAHLDGAHLGEAILGVAYLAGAHMVQARLRGANLKGAHLVKAHLEGAFLTGAHLEGAYLIEADLKDADLERAHLRGADLALAHLKGAHLEGAHLEGAHLEGAHLDGVDLRGANLEWASLEAAHLKLANLRDADLTHCKVTREQLAQAASLGGAKLPFDMAPLPAPGGEASTPKDQATDRRLAALHRARLHRDAWCQVMLRGTVLRADDPQKDNLLAALLAGGAIMPDGSKHE